MGSPEQLTDNKKIRVKETDNRLQRNNGVTVDHLNDKSPADRRTSLEYTEAHNIDQHVVVTLTKPTKVEMVIRGNRPT